MYPLYSPQHQRSPDNLGNIKQDIFSSTNHVEQTRNNRKAFHPIISVYLNMEKDFAGEPIPIVAVDTPFGAF